MHVAQVLESRDFSHRLRARLSDGVSFAAARQAAAAELTADAALLGQPNNVLGIEYCRSILRHGADLTVLTLPREGAPHDGALVEGVHPSASAIRALVEEGKREQALSWMAPAMAQAYRQEEEAGRAPVLGQRCEPGDPGSPADHDGSGIRRSGRGAGRAVPAAVRGRTYRCRCGAGAGDGQDQAVCLCPAAPDGALGISGTDPRGLSSGTALSAAAGCQRERQTDPCRNAGAGPGPGADPGGIGAPAGRPGHRRCLCWNPARRICIPWPIRISGRRRGDEPGRTVP